VLVINYINYKCWRNLHNSASTIHSWAAPTRPGRVLKERCLLLLLHCVNPDTLAGYKCPGRAICIRLHVDGSCRRIQVLSSVLLADTSGYMSPCRQFCRLYTIHVDGDNGYKRIQLDASGVNAALRSVSTTRVHGLSSRAELTARELGWIFWHPSTRAVNSGSGNRPLLCVIVQVTSVSRVLILTHYCS